MSQTRRECSPPEKCGYRRIPPMPTPGTPGTDRLFHAVLTDFGIAKLLTGGTGVTQAGIVGTLDYMAPEQIRGASLDARADIYAMGIMAFKMLTGRLPFEGDNPGTLVLAHLQTPPPNPSTIRADLPDAVSAAILRARPPGAVAFA